MARLIGVDIPDNKRVVISLTYIFGIGLTRSKQILKAAKVDESIRVKDLNEQQLAAIRNAASGYTVEGELRRNQAMDIKRLMEIGT